MRALVAEPKNPYYECLLPFGACTAARLNAEQGRNYDVAKLVNWCFAGGTPARGGDWGAVVGRWGEYDISGLIGARDRVFLMNTFDTASPLVPLVRYDPRFARAIGKWMLNAANAARLFYPEELPDKYQSAFDLKAFTRNAIAYEALSPNRKGQPIFADRDDWGPETREPTAQFSLYGSSHAGIFGAIVGRTSDEAILQLDCLATDFFRDKALSDIPVFQSLPGRQGGADRRRRQARGPLRCGHPCVRGARCVWTDAAPAGGGLGGRDRAGSGRRKGLRRGPEAAGQRRRDRLSHRRGGDLHHLRRRGTERPEAGRPELHLRSRPSRGEHHGRCGQGAGASQSARVRGLFRGLEPRNLWRALRTDDLPPPTRYSTYVWLYQW